MSMFVGLLAPVNPRNIEVTKLVALLAAWPTPYGPGDWIGEDGVALN